MVNLIRDIYTGDILDVVGNPGLAGFHGKLKIVSKAPRGYKEKMDYTLVVDDLATYGDTLYVGEYIEESETGEWNNGDKILFDVMSLNVEKTRFVNRD